MRGFYLAPWWWFVLRSGKRFSLRRILGLVIGIAALAEALGAGWRYALGGDRGAFAHAFPLAIQVAAAAAILLTAEPFFCVVRDSIAAGAFRSAELHLTSNGFLAWCAAVCTTITYFASPEIPFLARIRGTLEHTTDSTDAFLRFVIGAFIVWLPILFAAKMLAFAAEGLTFRRARRVAPPPRAPRFEVPPTIGPQGPIPGRIPAPGRIVAKRVEPLRSREP